MIREQLDPGKKSLCCQDIIICVHCRYLKLAWLNSCSKDFCVFILPTAWENYSKYKDSTITLKKFGGGGGMSEIQSCRNVLFL